MKLENAQLYFLSLVEPELTMKKLATVQPNLGSKTIDVLD